jgi:hypothetical protein
LLKFNGLEATSRAWLPLSVDMQRDTRLTAVRLRRDLALTTLSATRDSSIIFRLLVADDIEDEEDEIYKQHSRRARLISRSFEIEHWSEDMSIKQIRFRTGDIKQIAQFTKWPNGCMTTDGRVRTQRRRYTFYPVEGIAIVLARPRPVGRWRDMEELFFRSASACCEILYFTISIFFSTFSPLVRRSFVKLSRR